jgi:prevent-host-death family protein
MSLFLPLSLKCALKCGGLTYCRGRFIIMTSQTSLLWGGAVISWQTQEAKAKFSELIKMAESAPQAVTSRGKTVVVVMSAKEYARLTMPKKSFLELMQTSPLRETDIEFERDDSPPRDIRL